MDIFEISADRLSPSDHYTLAFDLLAPGAECRIGTMAGAGGGAFVSRRSAMDTRHAVARPEKFCSAVMSCTPLQQTVRCAARL